LVSQIKVGDRGQAYVVDAQGRLIAHPDISLVLCYHSRMAITVDQRETLRMLAGSPHGVTATLAHGFTVGLLAGLVRDGLTATPKTVHAGRQPIEVTWLTITDAGRRALTG
jgi:hypothetical protein